MVKAYTGQTYTDAVKAHIKGLYRTSVKFSKSHNGKSLYRPYTLHWQLLWVIFDRYT